MQSPKTQKKIGLLGGTFDPVHNGHLAVANHVLKVLNLDEIWFIPAALPPHKPGHWDNRNISGFAHRFAMLERTVEQNEAFVVSDIESKRSAPSYSIDTIKILVELKGRQADFSFIIGIDAFIEIDTWRQYKELPSLVNFIVISRPGYPTARIGEIILNNYPDYTFDHSRNTWCSSDRRGTFTLLHMQPVPVSSTEIREKVRKGENISGMVPDAVEDYIKKSGLYIE